MRLRLLTVLIGVLVPLAVPGTASAAAPTLHEHFGGVSSIPNDDEGPITCPLGGNAVASFSEEASFHGQDLIKPVLDGVGQAFFGHSNYWFRAEHVNLANGESFSVKASGLFKEQTAELLDAEAPFNFPSPRDEAGNVVAIIGPVYRFTAIEVAHVMVRNDDGKLVHNERGRILWSAVFDTRGDGEPGGLLISEADPVVLSGTNPFFEFCDMALDLTT